jgi:hypothetical protein
MLLGMRRGLNRRQPIGGGLLAPPYASSISARYEASLGTEDASSLPVADFAKFRYWRDQSGNGYHFDQSTAANQFRVRSSTNIPVTYVGFGDFTHSNYTLPQSTLVINKRAASFFALIELNQLMVQSTSRSDCIMSLNSSGGELRNRIVSGDGSIGVLQWIDANGTTTTTFKHQCSLALVGVILDAGEIRIVLNDQSQIIATPLAAGTVTGFNLMQGGGLGGLPNVLGYHAVIWYDHALDSTELAAVRSWATSRGAMFSPTKDLILTGASITLGHVADGNLDAARQYANAKKGQVRYRNLAFAGNTTSQQLGKVRGQLTSVLPNTMLHDYAVRQQAMILGVTNDITAGTALATIVANTTDIRRELQGYGYNPITFGVAPVGTWDATQEQKRLDYNAAMAALSARVYGQYLPPPAELTDPNNATYYLQSDKTHLYKAAFDLYLRDCQAYLDAWFAEPITTLQTWMKFDGNFQDSSIFKRDWETFNTTSFVDGLWGRDCLRVSSAGHARSMHLSNEIALQTISCMFWYKDRVGSGAIALFSKYTGLGGTHAVSRSGVTGRISLTWGNIGLTGTTDFRDTNWHCVAWVADTNGGRLYVSPDEDPANLVLEASTATVAGTLSVANRWRAGLQNQTDTGTPSDVDFQDLLLWNASKTLAEFQAIDMTTFTG